MGVQSKQEGAPKSLVKKAEALMRRGWENINRTIRISSSAAKELEASLGCIRRVFKERKN